MNNRTQSLVITVNIKPETLRWQTTQLRQFVVKGVHILLWPQTDSRVQSSHLSSETQPWWTVVSLSLSLSLSLTPTSPSSVRMGGWEGGRDQQLLPSVPQGHKQRSQPATVFTQSSHCGDDLALAAACVRARASGEAIDFQSNLGLVRQQSMGL